MNRRLSFEEVTLEEEVSYSIAFDWEVEKHTSTNLVIGFDFELPQLVSTTKYGRDTILLKVLDLSPFISAETGLPLTKEDFGFSGSVEGPTLLELSIPPLLSEEKK